MVISHSYVSLLSIFNGKITIFNGKITILCEFSHSLPEGNQVSQFLSTHVTSDRDQLCQLTSLIHRLRDEAPAEARLGAEGGRLLAREVIPSFFLGFLGGLLLC